MVFYAFNASTKQPDVGQYPLVNSAILDSGTSLHIFNDLSRFYNIRKAPQYDYVVAGSSYVPILAYGDVNITVASVKGPQTLRIRNVVYCRDFKCNLVSFDKLK